MTNSVINATKLNLKKNHIVYFINFSVFSATTDVLVPGVFLLSSSVSLFASSHSQTSFLALQSLLDLSLDLSQFQLSLLRAKSLSYPIEMPAASSLASSLPDYPPNG
jgi:hypothetical protein